MKNHTTKVLVIGGASQDILVVNNMEHRSPGGAGLYTALAAARCGASVTLFAPYPEPMPRSLEQVSSLVEWIGPAVAPDELPAFRISYEIAGTTYEKASFGAEASLVPADLPTNLSMYDVVHLVPLGNTTRQLVFIHACRERGASIISASTGIPLLSDGPERISDVIRKSDLFFLNEEEASVVFSGYGQIATSSGKHLFVTKGARGASVYLGDHEVAIEPVEADVLDPTGAGDTFCGSTIAGIGRGLHPVGASAQACVLAAEMITGIGPAKLQSESTCPGIRSDDRVVVNQGQIEKTAELISGLGSERPFDFIAPSLPRIDHPLAVDYFFVTTLQQFSFWSIRDGRYHLPLIDTIADEKLKGAFYLFMAYRDKLDTDPGYFSPERQASQSPDEMTALFRSDAGEDVMPAMSLHLDAAHRYGRTMLELGWRPRGILELASRSVQPLKAFLAMLDHVGGYREDPLRKKSALLAMILNNRPEKYFDFGDGESLPPIIDYHCMRSCLRMGLIDVVDDVLRSRLMRRAVLAARDESCVRDAAYRAVDQLHQLSGRSMATVDQYFFFARERCPEMTPPECEICNADAVCAHRKDMFQPVIRTDFY